jgi:hypothetical protein
MTIQQAEIAKNIDEIQSNEPQRMDRSINCPQIFWMLIQNLHQILIVDP